MSKEFSVKALSVLIALSGSLSLVAKPSEGDVKVGDATISIGRCTEVKASSHKTVIQWKDFSISKSEKVHFDLPHETAAVLNRVIGQHISKIEGQLQSNGYVYLLNPNGLLVGEEASIDTASFIGSTFDVLNSEFLKGENITFFGDSKAKIINHGVIRSCNGDVALIGHEVENHGIMEAFGGIAAILPCGGVIYQPNKETPIFIKTQGGLDISGCSYAKAFHSDAKADATKIIRKDGEIYLE